MLVVLSIIMGITILALLFMLNNKTLEIKSTLESNKTLIEQSQYKIIIKQHENIKIHTFDFIISSNSDITKETIFRDFEYSKTIFHNEDPEIVVENMIDQLKKIHSPKNIRVIFPK